MKNTNAAILELSNVGIGLPLGADRQWAVRDVSLTILPQQTLCLVGESGSGKSVIAQAIMGILPSALPLKEGKIKLLGKDIPKQRSPNFNLLRSVKMGMVFQDAVASLNPIKKVGHQLEEILLVHGVSRKERKSRVLKMLSAVLLPKPESAYRSYPHEMSGGQAQRIVIAGALLLNPSLLIADEPTTALDVTTQAEILELITKLKIEFNTSVLFITHDFGVVSEVGDQIAVMKDGKILEQGSVKNVLKNPQNEYTRSLLKAANLDTSKKKLKETEEILKADNISLTYKKGFFFNQTKFKAVQKVSLSLTAGSTLAVVGESGSGKSSLAKCLLRLEKTNSGKIYYRGKDITDLKGAHLKNFRSKVQVVLQDPFGALDPRFKIIDAIAEGPIIHGSSWNEANSRAIEMLSLVGLTPQSAERYPQEFSGGQRQRICIARALIMRPEVLIADEAVSALDVSIQVKILDLFEDLQKRLGFAMIFITHDLHVAAAISDSVIVMKDGRVVESGQTSSVFMNPQAKYTKMLISSAPGYQGGEVL